MPSGRPPTLYQSTESFRNRESELLCVSQVERLTGALLMYAMDYDDHLPIAGRWCDATYPYIKSDVLYRCPSAKDRYGYAFNLSLDQQRPSEVGIPARTMVLFESSAGKRNATDTGISLCKPPRHPGGNTLGYLDGHAAVTLAGGGR